MMQNLQRLRINYTVKVYPWMKYFENISTDSTSNGNRLLSRKTECARCLTSCWTIYNLGS